MITSLSHRINPAARRFSHTKTLLTTINVHMHYELTYVENYLLDLIMSCSLTKLPLHQNYIKYRHNYYCSQALSLLLLLLLFLFLYYLAQKINMHAGLEVHVHVCRYILTLYYACSTRMNCQFYHIF